MHLKFTRLPPSPLLPPLPLQFTKIGSTVFVRTERWTERERERERVRLCERVNIKLNGFYEIEQTIEWFSHDDISAKSNTRIEFRFLSYSQRY